MLTSFANHWTYLPIHQSSTLHIYLLTDPLISFLPTKLHNLSSLKRPANEVNFLMSKIVRHCLRFALLRSVLGPENSRQPTNRSDAKLISITTRFHALAVFLLLFWPLRSLWFWFYEIITTTVLLTMVVGTSGVQFGLWSCEWFTKSDDCEAGVRFVNHECDYRQNWTTRSPVTN